MLFLTRRSLATLAVSREGGGGEGEGLLQEVFFLQTINSFDQISKSLLLKFLHVCQQNTSSLSSVSSLSSFHLISLFIPGGSLRRVAFAGSPPCSCPGKPCPVQASSLFKIVKKLSHKYFWQVLTSEKTLSQLQPTFKTDLANK